MQDKQTGNMEPLDGQLAKEQALQAAKDKALPDRARQGQMLYVGQNVRVGRGKFTVTDISDEYVTLRGLPVEVNIRSRGKGKKRFKK